MSVAISSQTCKEEQCVSFEWYYSAIAERLCKPELGTYITYGIQVTKHTYAYTLHDISTSEKMVNNIVRKLNDNQASPVHLKEIVLDMIF